MANNIERQKIAENIAKIRAENRKTIANAIAARVLQELFAKNPDIENISNRDIAEVLRPITDNQIDFGATTARTLDFASLDDLINEVDPLIRRGLAKMRQERKTAA